MKEKWIIHIGKEEVKVWSFLYNAFFSQEVQRCMLCGQERMTSTEGKLKSIPTLLKSLCLKSSI